MNDWNGSPHHLVQPRLRAWCGLSVGAALLLGWAMVGGTNARAADAAPGNWGVVVVPASMVDGSHDAAGLLSCPSGSQWTKDGCGTLSASWSSTKFTLNSSAPHGLSVPEYIHAVAGSGATVVAVGDLAVGAKPLWFQHDVIAADVGYVITYRTGP